MTSRRFPAEWETQQGLLLGFPHNGKDWPGKLAAIQWAFIEFIKKVASYQQVFLVAKDKSHENQIKDLLNRAHINVDQVSFIHQKSNRTLLSNNRSRIKK